MNSVLKCILYSVQCLVYSVKCMVEIEMYSVLLGYTMCSVIPYMYTVYIKRCIQFVQLIVYCSHIAYIVQMYSLFSVQIIPL